MKQVITLFLFSVLLAGCMTQPEGTENRITVQLKDSTTADYNLLYLRDSAMLVLPAAQRFSEPSSAVVIPFNRIAHVYRLGIRTDGNAFWGALVGGFLATVLTTVPGDSHSPGIATAIAVPMGILIGAELLNSSELVDKTYDLSTKKDALVLKQYGKYPYIEPTELQKIK